MKRDMRILAHLWKDTRTGEWYCSAHPLGPSAGSSVRESACEDKDHDLVDDTGDEVSSEFASGIRLMIEFSLYCRSTNIDLSSSMSLRVTGFVPSWIFMIRRTAPAGLLDLVTYGRILQILTGHRIFALGR